MSDGSSLRQSWGNALNDAEARFRQLLTSSSSTEWKRVSNISESSTSKKGKARVSSTPELSDVVVHRKSSKSGDDVYRLILDVPADEEIVSLDPWRNVLSTPELRQEWDPAVIDAHLVEMFDHDTRICKTNFTLGWPANPRDAVTISRTIHDATTVIDISTSLPRSPDEPAYLRPSPPYVRSNVTLFAWCIQHLRPQQSSGELPKRKPSLGGRLRIICFWQHDLRAVWNIGSSSGVVQQLSTMVLGLFKTTTKRATRVSKLVGYGNGVTIERIRYQIDREALSIEYSIIPEDEERSSSGHSQDLAESDSTRENWSTPRAVEFVLPAAEGWDVQVSTKASSEEVEKLPWKVHAIRSSSYATSPTQFSTLPLDQILLRLSHAPLIDNHSLLKVQVVIEISGPSSGLRLNGVPQQVQEVEERDSYPSAPSILQDVSSATDVSFHTASSLSGATATSIASNSSAPPFARVPAERSAGAEKTVLSRVKRNYIYFSSLLQEPEAKWKRTTEARGVTITQLDSIDPTLVVYRAEATFVGVGLWDLYGAVVSPGAKNYWDKQHEDAILLEDVNELTELWHLKTKPAWPVNGRDAVVLKTVYKSPTAIHVFSFSADDPHLFPHIPPVDPNIIRTQVDLQGWAIEALSPTTTLLTLLEQSDPKGWTNKTAIPTQMISTLAGIGEFAIKCGGPPVVTRLTGAKANEMRYDHERLSFRIEYEPSASRRMVSPTDGTGTPNDQGSPTLPVIECELRCDMDTWAPSLDIVIDPPPQTISCLRRHRLSSEGGGLWLTITHDSVFVDDERLQVIVRRGPGREKGLVMVNGAKVNLDVEELPEQEIKTLSKRKRVKPPRIPLDQPPVVSVIRRRRAEWDSSDQDASTPETTPKTGALASATPSFSSPLARFFTLAVDQATSTTQQTIAAISPSYTPADCSIPSSSKLPLQYALDALSWTQRYHSNLAQAGWTSVSDKELPIRRKLASEISPIIPLHRGEKVIEGVSAEELATIITEPDCRAKWDDKFDSATILESYGSDCKTSFLVSKAGLLFRDRGFYLASVMARAQGTPSISRRNTTDLVGDVQSPGNGVDSGSGAGTRNAIFCVSASFSPDSINQFSAPKYNQYGLPIGRVYLDAWILETLDPYTKENYAVPSSRCTRLVAFDYAGSIPAAVNSMINATIPRAILAVESFVRGIASLPITRLPPPGFVLADRRDEDMEAEAYANLAWRLKRRDDWRTLVDTKYESSSKTYSSLIMVNFPSASSAQPNNAASPTRRSEQITPRPSRIGLNSIEMNDSPSQNGLEPVPGSSSSGVAAPASPIANSSLTMPGQRERANSGSSGFRGRSSSAFTVKGEVKHSTDLLVGEIVIDSKLYPKGYVVTLKSKTLPKMKASAAASSSRGKGRAIKLDSLFESTDDIREEEYVLPLSYSLHTMPSSPLHSSGMNTESPTRHLLRLSLPTAQYQISTVKDPLTGELQHPPPKPTWLLEMEESGAVIKVEVRSSSVGKGKAVVVDGSKDGNMQAGMDGRSWNAEKKGWEVTVVSEKESLTSLGREELSDDRVSKMGVLSRATNETETLPHELKCPVAVADNLLDPSVAEESSMNDGQDLRNTEEYSSSSEISEELPRTQTLDPPDMPHAPRTPGGAGGLLNFLQSYPNPLTRFTAGGMIGSPPGTSTSSCVRKAVEGRGEGALVASTQHSEYTTRHYTMSTLIIVALIAFLFGSLLRSLLSPADFIYVVTDLREAEEASSGWREIRRLFEIKYIIAGWDFQIAVVRRH